MVTRQAVRLGVYGVVAAIARTASLSRTSSRGDIVCHELVHPLHGHTRTVEIHEQVSDQVFHVLLSLVDGPRHGYGIIQDVEGRTGGAFTLGSGTLYSAIRRLGSKRWIRRVPAPEAGDPRRKYYGLTDLGREVIQAEALRLAALVRYARAKDLVPSHAD
jgi:DNA-binding MarR family transcriptional regulator